MGVDPAQVVQVLSGGLAASRVLELKGPSMIARQFQPGFRVNLHRKDLGIALAVGLDAELGTADALRELLTPKRDSSWIYYENRLEWESDDGLVELRTLPVYPLTGEVDRGGVFDAGDENAIADVMAGADRSAGIAGSQLIGGLIPPPPATGPGPAGGVLDNTIAVQPPFDARGNNWFERRVRPGRSVIMTGRAGRYGFEVPEPDLTEVEVTDAVTGVKTKYPARRACRQDLGEGFSVQGHRVPGLPWITASLPPVYDAVWRLRYVVAGDPPRGPITQPPNPDVGPN
jgi:hypothetical protein